MLFAESDNLVSREMPLPNKLFSLIPPPRVPHEDTIPSFSPNRATGLWYCHSGCGGGNIYQLAVALNMDNPRQYIEPSTMDSKKHRTNGYEPNNALKSENEQTIDVDKTVKYVELKNRYGERVELEETYKNKYIGKNDNGETVFIYPKGIKIHKKYWIMMHHWISLAKSLWLKKCQVLISPNL